MKYFKIGAIPMLSLGILLATGTIVSAQSLNSSQRETDSSRHDRGAQIEPYWGTMVRRLKAHSSAQTSRYVRWSYSGLTAMGASFRLDIPW